ncbi:hypothetical protein R3P38DRAFT_2857799 [Favolaschia claudopus]|uniref:F-box domain-containing protein n=1 Tax=Favolaschia claudopus TaxID=2862362 RepID=A0AAW0DJA0_9AGAR
MALDSSTAPFLPPELEREIFEIAAVVHPATICHLILVSHRVYDWVERIKFNTVIPKQIDCAATCTIHELVKAIKSETKPIYFFRDRVRHLFIQNLLDEAIETILSACGAVESLVLFQSFGTIPSLQLTTSLRRLSIYLWDLLEHPKQLVPHPLFTSVTHLDLFDQVHSHRDNIVEHLALMPMLTHLALWNESTPPDVLAEVLERCIGLETVIEMHGSMSSRSTRDDEMRIVSMTVEDTQYLEDWITGTQGGSDFWARADAFIAKKRRGEIKPSSRCWIEDTDGI